MPTLSNYQHDDEGESWVVDIDYTVIPGSPGCHTLPNGDPGYPEDPATVELTAYRVKELNRYDDNGELVESVPLSIVLDKTFEAMVDKDFKLFERIESACFESTADNADCPDWGIDPDAC